MTDSKWNSVLPPDFHYIGDEQVFIRSSPPSIYKTDRLNIAFGICQRSLFDFNYYFSTIKYKCKHIKLNLTISWVTKSKYIKFSKKYPLFL